MKPVRILGAALLLCTTPTLLAQSYPAKPIRWIVPFAAGSSTDISGRFFGQQLSVMVGQPVVIENRPGADGAIGIVAAKNAPADGYTQVVAGWTNLTVNPVVMKDLQYDPVKDFKPITGFTRSMLGIAVSPSTNIRTVAELSAAAKKAPKKLDFGSFSAGYRLALEWLAASAGFQFNAIPYKASAQMNTDLMGGQIVAAIDGMSALAQQARSGKLRVVAVTGERRHPEFPDIPTVRESGYPDFAIYGWSALYTRSETPDDITTRLADAMQKALASNAAQDYVKTLGAELIGGGPSGMRQFQSDQLQNFRRVADLAGIKPE